MSTRPGVRFARLLLILCCALLSVYQCWTLLQLFSGEPVSATVSYTPWEDVDVPGLTVCGTPFPWQEYQLLFGGKMSVAKQLWQTAVTVDELFHSCDPQCKAPEGIKYPGGRVEVGIGHWTSWVALTEGALCHTLIPNVTWGQLSQAAQHRQFDLRLELWGTRQGCDFRVFVHPRRRPVVTNPGVRGVQQDLKQRDACRGGERSADLVHVKLISRIHDREDLHRAPCTPGRDYFYETCIINCSYRQWADTHNCSTPEMLEKYPDLPECSRRAMKRLLKAGGLTANASDCHCLPACYSRSFVADTGLESLPVPTHSASAMIRKVLVVQLSSASLAEEVTTERRSYGLPSLLSEMGGFISLILGVSVLSLADTLTEMMTKTRQTSNPAPAPADADAESHDSDTAGSGDERGAKQVAKTPGSKQVTETPALKKLADDAPATENRSERDSIFTIQS